MDERFQFHRWAEWEFLIVALRQLERAAETVASTAMGAPKVRPTLALFRRRLPGLQTRSTIRDATMPTLGVGSSRSEDTTQRRFGTMRHHRGINGCAALLGSKASADVEPKV